MKRRMAAIDYSQPGIYMITMATEGRKLLFGKVVADGESARMEMTDLGQWVNREVEHIPRHYPQISIVAKQVMPDHLHFILYVKEPLPVHLGRVINGFKSGCNKGYRKFFLPQSGEQRNTPLNPPRTQSRISHVPPMGRSVEWFASERQEFQNQEKAKRDRSHGTLFETGYHDRVLFGKGQLQRMIDYIHDNPRRLLMRHANSEWFRPKFGVRIGKYECSAIGNIQLLQRHCLAVRVSRRCSEEQIQTHIDTFLAAARNGTVLVSPSISPGEKRVMRAAFDAKLPVIVLMENGFTEFSKPTGEQFNACAEGRLLLIAPWEYHTERKQLTAQQCQELNLLALTIQEIAQ